MGKPLNIVLTRRAFAGMALDVVSQQSFVVGRDRCLALAVASLTAVRGEIDAEFVGKIDEVAPGITVALGESIDELLDPSCSLGDDPFSVALSQCDLFAERILK